MNGYKLLERAVRLLGCEQLDENLKIIGHELLSAVAEEMGYMPPESLSEKPPFIGEEETRTAIYGLAMLIANAGGDSSAALNFSDIYNRRLSGRRNRTDRVKEKLFWGEEL